MESIYATAGGVITTGDDIVKWIELLLGKGVYNGTRLISAEAIQEMHTPQMMMDTVWGTRWSTITNPFAHLIACGLGWVTFEYQGRKVVEHMGANFGSSVVALVPEEGLGVAVFVNSSYPNWKSERTVALVPEEGLGVAVFVNSSYPNWKSERTVAALKTTAIDLVLGTSKTDWSEVFLKVHQSEEPRE
jgi:CubicO group peptidase (beta-lactamase class C family)